MSFVPIRIQVLASTLSPAVLLTATSVWPSPAQYLVLLVLLVPLAPVVE